MSALREILSRYALSVASAQPLGNHGGFSGAQLWRIEIGGASFCLRAWPTDNPTPQRLHQLHAWMTAARTAGLAFVPHIVPIGDSTFLTHSGHLWELTEWLPGRADFHQQPAPVRLRAALIALARLHEVWARPGSVRGPCPALVRRLERIDEWRSVIASGWRPQFELDDPVSPPAHHAWQLLAIWAERVPSLLSQWADRSFRLHPCLCDVWHDHVLFEGDTVSGIIDYGSVRLDHPAADLARLLGSLIGDDATAWVTGFDAYDSIRPLSPDDETLARALDRSGVIIGVINWLMWLYRDGRRFENRQLVAERLAGLVRRLQEFVPESAKI